MMRNVLFQTICRTGIFMICAQALVHFRPQGSYEKYLKLLVSVMVLIQLFLPLGNFLSRFGGQAAADQMQEFRAGMEQSMEQARKEAAQTEALLEQMTLEEVRRRLEEQVSLQGESSLQEWESLQGEGGLFREEDIKIHSVEISDIAVELDRLGEAD